MSPPHHEQQSASHLPIPEDLEYALAHAIISSAEDAIIASDLEGNIASWNPAASILFGHVKSHITGQAFASLFPPGQLPDHLMLIKLFQNNSVIGQFETLARHKDGHEFPVSLTISAIRGQVLPGAADDNICGLSLIVRDFSNGYKTAERLTQSERHFREVVNAAPNAMIMISNDGLIDMVNTQTEKNFNYTRDELLGQTIEILIPERYREQYLALRDSYFASPATHSLNQGHDFFGLRKDGSEFPLQITFSPIHTIDGLKALLAIVDTSERQRFTDELSRRNRELDNFVYVASHDLKSPLRNVNQLAGWISEDLEGKIGEETKEHLHLMQARIRRMEKLLDDLLLYFRADRLGGAIECIDFADMVRDVFDLCCGDRSFDLELQGSFPMVPTHKVALELVLRNLINNAIKHHDRQRGYIIVRSLPDVEHYVFEIADDGPGIAEEHRERIFGMFQTLRPRDEVEGSGMGLAVIKKTIESLGGNISISANQPRGAVFRFSWPRQEGN